MTPARHRPRPEDVDAELALRRELYFFALYRLLEAGLIVFLAFSPLAESVTSVRIEGLARITALVYGLLALGLVWAAMRSDVPREHQAGVGLGLDIAAAGLALHAFPDVHNGIALLLVFNVGAGALLMPARTGFTLAAVAAVVVVGEAGLSRLVGISDRSMGEASLFGITYLASAMLTQLLGGQMRASHALAERRGAEVASLAQINELVIRRMRTGVLVVDGDNHVEVFNEAAWYLIGNPPPDRRNLGEIAPELSRRLWHWLNERPPDNSAVVLAEGAPEVIPRFSRLAANRELVLIFLEDTSLYSRRAEELTLATLGRLSASIAHEIRNPLASISYSAQLLEEVEGLSEGDRRLVEIIYNQCQRMNGIVESILGMARRQRAEPETIELGHWVRRFVEEYRGTHPMGSDELLVVTPSRPMHAMADPGQLHQVLIVLVQNAFNYGRMPETPARVTVTVRPGEAGYVWIDIVDRGPGIPPRVAENIFEPFFTTSAHGTGLGLYIARQLCEANQAGLDYLSLPGGGSCFRVSLRKESSPPEGTTPIG